MARPKAHPDHKRETITARLPAWLKTWLEGQKKSSGRIIEDALVAQHKLAAPNRRKSDVDA
jgi:hypothetical protein